MAFSPCKHDAHGRPMTWKCDDNAWHVMDNKGMSVWHCMNCNKLLLSYFIWNGGTNQFQCSLCAITSFPLTLDHPDLSVTEQIFGRLQVPIERPAYDAILEHLDDVYPALHSKIMEEGATYRFYAQHCARLAALHFDITVSSVRAAFYHALKLTFMHVPTWAVYERTMQRLKERMTSVDDKHNLRLIFEEESSKRSCTFYYCLVGEVAARQVCRCLEGATLTPHAVMKHFNVPPNKVVYHHFEEFLKLDGCEAPDYVTVAGLVACKRLQDSDIFRHVCAKHMQGKLREQLKHVFVTLPLASVYKRTVQLLASCVHDEAWNEFLTTESETFHGYLLIAKDMRYMEERDSVSYIARSITLCGCTTKHSAIIQAFLF